MATTDTSKESFKANRKFYDDRNYPRGLSRSGDFTLSEARILENHGIALQELMSGKRQAETEEEKNFLLVCEGEAEATTTIEKAWKKYQNKVLSPKHFHTLFGKRKVDAEDSASEDDSVDITID